MAGTISPDEAVEQFLESARGAGLRIKGQPIADGKVHRVEVEGTSKKSGGYVLHMDERPAGKIWNYKTGYESGWSASGATVPLTAEERKERDLRISAQRDAESKEKAFREEEVARWSAAQWHTAKSVKDHPYLSIKGIHMDDARVTRDGRLIIPMHDVDGNIWNLQRISQTGEKRYVDGGRKRATHYLLSDKWDVNKPLILAEGFATGATVHRSTGQSVAVCFDSSNLLPVAKAYRERFPDLRIIVAADNDRHLTSKQTATGRFLTNVGLEKANAVAAEVGAAVLAPEFPAGHPGTDWNDYYAEYGLEPITQKFKEQLEMDERLSELAKANEARPAQLAAIERVNALGGDLEQSQKILTLAFDSMKTRGVESLSECWTRAADIAVEQLSVERSVAVDTEKKIPETEMRVDQQDLYEHWPPVREVGQMPRDQEKLTRQQVIDALQNDLSLRDKDMSWVDLSGLTFHGKDLSGSNLSNTINRGTVYRKCFALATDFSGAQFENSLISENVAAASIWNEAKMSNTMFSNNGMDHAQMRNMLVVGKEIERPIPMQPLRITKGVTLVDSIKEDASRMASFASRTATRIKRAFSGPSEEDKRLNDTVLAAIKACGWVGDGHSQTLPAAFHLAKASFERLAKSGEFTQEQIDKKVDLYQRVIEEQAAEREAKRKRIPEVSGNNFQHADFTGSRMMGVDVRNNDFQSAILQNFFIDGQNRDNQFHDLVTHLQQDAEKAVDREEPEQAHDKRVLRNMNQRSSRAR